MTSLLPPSVRTGPADRRRPRGPSPAEAPRPLVALAALGGAAAALAPLVVCLAVGVVGWFASDAGSHGAPRDGLRVGALGWLVAHGSGVRVDGVEVTALPLGLTLLCAVVLWRFSLRVGEALWAHGPDADRLGDGERDWTVPTAALVLTATYAVVVAVTHTLATTPATAASLPAALGWTLALGVLVALPALAVGSGRAAVWLSAVPPLLREVVDVARRVLVAWLLAAAALLLAALVVDLGTAANVLAQLHTSVGEALLLCALCLLLVPNAVVLSGAYLLGPGFAVGTGTVVSPTVVLLGPVPMVPLLAALPDNGPVPAWTPWLVVVPALAAAVAAGRAQHRQPSPRWDHVAVRGAGGGVLAGLATGVLAALSGGAVGPGRMQQVGPAAFDVLVHAVTALGVGALLGALAVHAWSRHRAARDAADVGPDGS